MFKMSVYLPLEYKKGENKTSKIFYDNVLNYTDDNPLYIFICNKPIHQKVLIEQIMNPKYRGVRFSDIVTGVTQLGELRKYFDVVYSIKPYKPTSIQVEDKAVPIENIFNMETPYIPWISPYSSFELSTKTDLRVEGILFTPGIRTEMVRTLQDLRLTNKHCVMEYRDGSMFISKSKKA